MKKLFFLFLAVAFTFSLSSCERCATCTYNDPADGQIVSDFCSKGRAFEDQKQIHEEQGWSCSEE